MKERLDILLVERRLVESRVKAQWLIKKGYVIVNEMNIIKPGKRIENNSSIRLTKKFPYVGRGGLKLEAALNRFSIVAKGKICADIGASVGGFTDCLLQNGAEKIYVIDTAKELLHPSLKCKDENIVKLLGVDARKLKSLPTNVDIVTVDVTFSSLKSILPNVKNYLKKEGDIIVLVKPLFEMDFRKETNFKIIKDIEILRKILWDLLEWNINNSFFPIGLIVSPLLGKGGSIEFLIHIRIDKKVDINFEELINQAFKDAKEIKF
ncbi:MAG: TlyA family RNA methyltransferase [Candidatus Lokiarchaeota archaeon]|jgi:23S rRNA (cytidine1920-2'-O)/16S rRNA (cytidine1409-2'-O)-methyltransferase|nr:TlyA family RNA methyltransferase [Candidatus Lokiarchaeota archaeon]